MRQIAEIGRWSDESLDSISSLLNLVWLCKRICNLVSNGPQKGEKEREGGREMERETEGGGGGGLERRSKCKEMIKTNDSELRGYRKPLYCFCNFSVSLKLFPIKEREI